MKVRRRADLSANEKKKADRIVDDPVYCIETFFHILNKSRQKVPFRLNPPQRRYAENRSHFDIILKARKEGFSSLIEAIWLHSCMFTPNVRAVTMSHELESTVRHFERVRYFLDNMGLTDMGFKWELESDSQRQLAFKHTGSVYWIGTAGAKAFGRGDDITHFHGSEVAFYQNQDILTGVLEACVPDAWRVLESTANGQGDIFHRLWREATTKGTESKWKPHFFAWFEDPTNTKDGDVGELSEEERAKKKSFGLSDAQILWYRDKVNESVDKALVPQEHPATATEAFISSGAGAFDKDGLAAQDALEQPATWVGLIRDAGEFPEFVIDTAGRLRIWKQPEDGHSYIMPIDVSKGLDGGDFSVAPIFDRYNWELVAKWYGKIDPRQLGKVCFGLGSYYNWAQAVPESWPGPGNSTCDMLVEMKYPKIYRRHEGQRKGGDEGWGWHTTQQTREEAISLLQDVIRRKKMILRDADIISEFRSFVRHKNGKYAARASCFDDQVMACAIAAHVMTYDPWTEMHGRRDVRNVPILAQRLVKLPQSRRGRSPVAGMRGEAI